MKLEDIPQIKDLFEKTYAIGTDDTNDLFLIKLLFSVKCLRKILAMQRELLLLLINGTLNFMQNITWRHHEFSKEKFNREHYILFGVTH